MHFYKFDFYLVHPFELLTRRDRSYTCDSYRNLISLFPKHYFRAAPCEKSWEAVSNLI